MITLEKLQDIHENGYCFWALNKMNTETVRYFCSHNDKDDEGHDQDIYVIMKYTDSPSEIKKKLGGQVVRRDEESYEGNYIVAKLKNPYFVKLRLDNKQKKRNKFEE